MTGYCWTCGWLETPLDRATAMCSWCRDHWKPGSLTMTAASAPAGGGRAAALQARSKTPP
jgi:hypothetical protein